ncbi:MAG: hypothetical protein PS018_13405 [bacterium]|nr:hypothetical protein [bacterium]
MTTAAFDDTVELVWVGVGIGVGEAVGVGVGDGLGDCADAVDAPKAKTNAITANRASA